MAPKSYILHLELEANPRKGIPAELLRYNTMINLRHDVPVETVLILLRPKALVSDMTGHFECRGVTGRLISEFHYHIERVWDRPLAYWQERGIALEAAFSLVTDEAGRKLEHNILQFRERVKDSVADETTANSLISASYFMCGLRYNRAMVKAIYRKLNMLLEESTTYQDVLQQGRRKGRIEGEAEGEIKGKLKVLIQLGTERFGKPNRRTSVALRAIKDANRLDVLVSRLLHVKTWDELLAAE